MRSVRRSAQQSRSASALGFEAAVGLDTDPDDLDATEPAHGRTCAHCGATGRIYMVDTPRIRAYLTCPGCGHEWHTGRFDVISRRRRRRRVLSRR